jgi:hypothetical protein
VLKLTVDNPFRGFDFFETAEGQVACTLVAATQCVPGETVPRPSTNHPAEHDRAGLRPVVLCRSTAIKFAAFILAVTEDNS